MNFEDPRIKTQIREKTNFNSALEKYFCKKCNKEVFLFLSKAGNIYLSDDPNNKTAFHSKTCQPDNKKSETSTKNETKISHWGKELPDPKPKKRSSSECRNCHKQIYWTTSKGGKPYPIDDPNDKTSFHSLTCVKETPTPEAEPKPKTQLKKVDIPLDLDPDRLLVQIYSTDDKTGGQLMKDAVDLHKLVLENLDWYNQKAHAETLFNRLGLILKAMDERLTKVRQSRKLKQTSIKKCLDCGDPFNGPGKICLECQTKNEQEILEEVF
ncbi:MAG: hypothetical protein ACFFCI_02285 [Promethearchaeota archaeon]